MAHKAVLYSVIGAHMELLIHLYSTDTILSVKSKAEEKLRIPSEQHELVHKVDKLNDKQCINDYGIKTEETLILALTFMW